MTNTTSLGATRVIVGVDTHRDEHVAVAIDRLGAWLGQHNLRAVSSGYDGLHRWASGLGETVVFGIEGTGSYGAGLARFLAGRGRTIIEVNRPDRVEMIRMLKIVKSSAMKARTQAMNQMKALIVTAPLELRHQLAGLHVSRLVTRYASFRPGPLSTPTGTTKYSLRLLARRHGQLTAEIDGTDTEMLRLTAEAAPALV